MWGKGVKTAGRKHVLSQSEKWLSVNLILKNSLIKPLRVNKIPHPLTNPVSWRDGGIYAHFRWVCFFHINKDFLLGIVKQKRKKKKTGFFPVHFHANNYIYVEHPLNKFFARCCLGWIVVKGQMVCLHAWHLLPCPGIFPGFSLPCYQLPISECGGTYWLINWKE